MRLESMFLKIHRPFVVNPALPGSCKLISMVLLSLCLTGCLFYKTESGFSFFKPDYMHRDRPVTEQDAQILERALQLMQEQGELMKQDDRFCFCGEKWSLFCAMAKASVDITGQYSHRRVAMQELRFTIDDHFNQRWRYHRLEDFNNHQETTFGDVIWVLNETHARLLRRRHYSTSSAE